MQGRNIRFSKSIFRTRTWAYTGSVVFVLVTAPMFGLDPLLAVATLIGTVTSWITRNRAAPALAFSVDMAVAVVFALVGYPFLAFLIVVGWVGVVGMITGGGHWGYAVAGGVTAIAVVAIHDLNTGGSGFSPETVIAGALTVMFGATANTVARLVTGREMELEALFQRIPAAMYRTTTDGALVEGNPALGRLLGTGEGRVRLTSQEIDAMHVDPTARIRFRRSLETASRVQDFEMAMITKTGRRVDVMNSANVIRRPDGSVEFYEGVVFDITALRQAQESRERLAKIVEATSDLVVMAEPDGSIIYANRAAQAWVHTNIGGDDLTRVPQLVSDENLAKMMNGLTVDRIWEGELELETAGRVLYTRVVAHRFDGDDGTYYAIVGHDLTAEREVANRLTALVESKDEFIAAVSHELRTPLAAVVGMAAELRDRGDELGSDVAAELIEHVAEQSQEVADIVEDLLVAARIDSDSIVLIPEPMDIASAVSAVVRALPGSRPPDWLAMSVEGHCLADPRRVRQILRNLLTNALRYGGRRVSITSEIGDGVLRLRVSDDGVGVPEDRVDQIFEPFERAHVAGTQPSSVGLGLTVSRWLARQMRGELTYTRNDDASVFTLTLPASTVTP